MYVPPDHTRWMGSGDPASTAVHPIPQLSEIFQNRPTRGGEGGGLQIQGHVLTAWVQICFEGAGGFFL